MADSSLVIYERNSDKCNDRDHAIDRITIHCYVGQVTAERGVDYLCNTDRQASVNYVVGIDGIGEMIPEAYRAWTSSSWDNDRRAITIETACDTSYPYAVNDDVLAREIELVTDIMRRYGKNNLVWIDDKDEALSYEPADNEMLMTVHRWFAATACPGDYLMDRMGDIANAVNANLNDSEPEPVPEEPAGLPENPKNYNNDEFINIIAPYVINLKENYDICVASPIIAQACLESGYGKSDKATFYNFFGLKYRPNRVNCACGYFNADSAEQNPDGSYEPCNTDWYAFDGFENGVKGYFEFLMNAGGRYDNLKGITDPREYLEIIKADGYATSIDYVDSVMNTLNSNDLTRFDGVDPAPIPEPEPTPEESTKSIDEVAIEVIQGRWGNGQERKDALEAAGYNYDEVQGRVNEMLCVNSAEEDTKEVDIDELARQVINGDWGNGQERVDRLTAAGYDYNTVQGKVDEILGGGPAQSEGKSIEELTNEVIEGRWGNGAERKEKLEGAGYNYQEVQDRVNQILLG